MTMTASRLFTSAAFAAAMALSPALAAERDNPMVPGATWTDLRPDVVGDAEILDGTGLISLDAPYRAFDAATVPVRITQSPDSDARIVRLTLVIDENPSPVVAEFDFGPAMGRINLETRVRLNDYSNIRAIAETADGKLWMTGRFVKGAGGCAAPGLKDMSAAIAAAGNMRLKLFGEAGEGSSPPLQSGGRREAQLMIRHPNFSGMQRNQVSLLIIPAFFVDEIDVFLGEEKLFHMEGGISISEDPSFRFGYNDNGAETFRVEAGDTEGARYEKTFPAIAGPAS